MNAPMNEPSYVTLTDAAIARVKALMARSDKPVRGLRIGVDTTGCSGLAYVVEYAADKRPDETEVDMHGVALFIDPKARPYLVGTEIDFVTDKLQSGFVFRNPNETGRCGCGESFTV